jgi:hypothetical protein
MKACLTQSHAAGLYQPVRNGQPSRVYMMRGYSRDLRRQIRRSSKTRNRLEAARRRQVFLREIEAGYIRPPEVKAPRYCRASCCVGTGRPALAREWRHRVQLILDLEGTGLRVGSSRLGEDHRGIVDALARTLSHLARVRPVVRR